jgi:signal transduction histidine kinase
MVGTPTRVQNLDGLALVLGQFCAAATVDEVQRGIVRSLAGHLRQAKPFVVLRQTAASDLDFQRLHAPSAAIKADIAIRLASHLEAHPELLQKMSQGEMVGMTRRDAGPADGDSAGLRNMLLFPINAASGMAGVIGLELSAEAMQHADDDDVEFVRQIAHYASPVIERLRELETLRQSNCNNEMLQAIVEMQTHFQSNIAHELRTPLGTVRGYIRMVLDGRAGDVPESQRAFLNTAIENSNRLITLVTWMSHILQLGRPHLTLGAADLVEVCTDSLRFNSAALSAKSITLRQEVPPDSFTTICDREKLGYVFNSLLAHAIENTAAGGQISIEFSRGRQREISVKICDHGEALPPEQVNRIFERYTGASVSASTPGDVGLAGVYDIIGLHGGRLFVNSRPGEGTTFLFTLPAVGQDSEEKGSDDETFNPGRRRR